MRCIEKKLVGLLPLHSALSHSLSKSITPLSCCKKCTNLFVFIKSKHIIQSHSDTRYYQYTSVHFYSIIYKCQLSCPCGFHYISMRHLLYLLYLSSNFYHSFNIEYVDTLCVICAFTVCL